MAVTIQMIGEKEFKIKAHGYDQDEVDEFLDEIADEFEDMENKIRELSARLAEAQEEAEAAAQAPAPAQPARPESSYASQEESIRNMIINTQRVCDETLANAQERSEEMVKEASEQAGRIVADAHSETQQLEDEMAALRAAALDFRARFQRLIDDQAQILKTEGELFKKK
ncbi:MAG: DivIVA domain-containing protein [Clostridia bacterium]|nr:DivIVA domain-containing protein [Clostridia bacterium]